MGRPSSAGLNIVNSIYYQVLFLVKQVKHMILTLSYGESFNKSKGLEPIVGGIIPEGDQKKAT